ncbi:hypothetical protein [Halorussus salinus]|uniref:hypothetical protein n=1 Tax=Halorussus salinus TaxID=1364935 RepID=UPI0010922684|nr:hypothetical protein [Halorussus salinus]
MTTWAEDFYEIPEAVTANEELQNNILDLVNEQPIHGKVTQGGNRTESLREILREYFRGETNLEQAFQEVSSELPRHESPHASNNQVFAKGWAERLVRTQASRFYNQAVLLLLQERGDQTCFIPHSSEEDVSSDCTQMLAGNEVEIELLLNRLRRAHVDGEWHEEVMIPDHPHCTHTVVSTSESM